MVPKPGNEKRESEERGAVTFNQLRDIRDASLREGVMSAVMWYGQARDFMCAVASGAVENVQVGCSACYVPLSEDERDTPKCPYCLSIRSEWPIENGVPDVVLQMYVEAETLGNRAQKSSVTRSLLVVGALSVILLLNGVWPLAGLVLLGGGLFSVTVVAGRAKGRANLPYFQSVWREYRERRGEEPAPREIRTRFHR